MVDPREYIYPQLAELQPEEAEVISRFEHDGAALAQTRIPPVRANIRPSQLRLFHQLTKDTSIVIKPADKNLGLTIVNRSWYEEEALKHLSSPKNYHKLSDASTIPILDIISALRSLRRVWLSKKIITSCWDLVIQSVR